MIVNFRNIPCRPSIKREDTTPFDLAEDIADSIYSTTTNTEDFGMAFRIFNSPVEGVELTEQEIINVANYIGGFPVWIQQGIVNVLTESIALMQAAAAESAINEHEPIPGETAPDGGVYAGEDGMPAPAEWVDIEETPVVEEETPIAKKTNRKSKK